MSSVYGSAQCPGSFAVAGSHFLRTHLEFLKGSGLWLVVAGLQAGTVGTMWGSWASTPEPLIVIPGRRKHKGCAPFSTPCFGFAFAEWHQLQALNLVRNPVVKHFMG